METWQILVTVGVPSGIFGFAVWLIERKIEQHERKRTEEAKKRENIEAQRKHGLAADGICGPKSWTVLSGADKYL